MVILGDGKVVPSFLNGVKEASSIYVISDPVLGRILGLLGKAYATF